MDVEIYREVSIKWEDRMRCRAGIENESGGKSGS